MLALIKKINARRSITVAVFVFCLLFTSIFIFKGNTHAFTVNYNPSNLIDNGTLLNNSAMSEGAIQIFLTNVGSGLASVQDVEACDSTIAPYYTHCSQTISAAQIIYDAAQAYGVNPEAILATLQKEQSLVTQPAPPPSDSTAVASYQAALNCAMGYNSCNDYVGFFTQVDNGAWTLVYNTEAAMQVANWMGWLPATNYRCSKAGYIDNGTVQVYSTGLYPGNTVTFDDPGGTAETVTLANAATASLYCYTPYVGPYSETGYSGSYNFVYYFQLWFGNTQSSTAYAWDYEGQGEYTNDGYSDPFTNGLYTAPGQTAYLSVTARNVGYDTWQQSVVHLGTSHPEDRDSVFTNDSWLSPTRIAMQQSSVIPGADATFEFSITAPLTTGTYYEYFNLVADGITWMDDPGLYFTINVVQPQTPTNNTNTGLQPGQTLSIRQHLLSPDTQSTLALQPDGDVILTSGGQVTWSNSINNSNANSLIMQYDGNLVEYDSNGRPVWSSGTGGNTGDSLALQIDGNLVIYSSSGSPLWSTNTGSNPYYTDKVDSFIQPGAVIFPGQILQTANRDYSLIMQYDGNLVEYNSNGRPIWSSGTGGNTGDTLVMQNDGNLVIYSWQGIPIWSSGTGGLPDSYFTLQPDGSLTVATPNDDSILLVNSSLQDVQTMFTPGLSYSLVMQNDGNLVIYDSNGRPIWSSGTGGNTGDTLVMQNDGNLVIYSWQGIPIWSSGTSSNKNDSLVLENNGNLVIYNMSGRAIWNSNT